MLKKFTYIVLEIASIIVAVSSFAQTPQNKPNNQLQVSSAGTVETPPIEYPAGTKVNYVRTREAIEPITDEAIFNSKPYTSVKEATQYLDGLGRPLQTVARQAGTGSAPKDIVSPVKYDAFGREVFNYLPYVQTTGTNTSDGSFKTNPFNHQASFYSSSTYNPSLQGEQVYYNKTEFEASPLNRVTKTMAPGNSWAGSGKGVSMEYRVNDVNDAVRIWNISNTALTYDAAKNIPYSLNVPATPSTNGTYPPGQLFETVTIDEHGKKVVEYKDKEGKVILKKVQIADAPSEAHDGWLCTYYVYDDLGQLRFVIPPKAVKKMTVAGWQLTEGLINELCFRYEYDARQRMIAKKVPGAGWAYMVNDKRDRLTYTQDANMRKNNQWMAILYDALNRPVVTGIIIYTGNRDDLQLYTDNNFNPNSSAANNAVVNIPWPIDLDTDTRETSRIEYTASSSITFNPGFESETGANFIAEIAPGSTNENVGVQNNPLPPGHNFIALTITYYDDYDHTSKIYNIADKAKLDNGGNSFAEVIPGTRSTLTKGMVTGTKVRVLENPNNLAIGEWLETVNFYDDKGRAIQVQSDNYKHGSDIVTNLYDFSGKVLTTYAVHKNPAASATTRVKTNMLYDHAGRVLEVKKIINDDPASVRTIAKHLYDEMGQLKDKQLGQKRENGTLTSNPLETLSYEYNIRGWLKGINRAYNKKDASLQTDRWFGMDLSYDWGFDKNQFNGNIAGMQWRSRGDGEQRAYGFGYDAANRIECGDFNQKFSSGWGKDGDNFRIDFSMYMGDLNSQGQVVNAYDENGNIQKMKQWGLKLNASPVIDQISYSYNEGNKLLKVEEDINIGTSDNKLGDFTDKNRGSDDYGYDVNGNLIVDKNKRINGTTGVDIPANAGAIQYNHLNLPYKITVRTDAGTADKGYIKYIYDAAGNKLEKWVHENQVGSTPPKDVITDYIAGYVYEQVNTELAKLQFLGQEEGRIRLDLAATQATDKYKYDYFIKDHLGNVRMVLTDEVQQNAYPAATLEGSITQQGAPNAINIEQGYYTINTNDVADKSLALNIPDYQNNNGNPPYNNNPYSNVTALSQKVYKLNSATSKKGLDFAVKVMSGDRIDIFGKSYFKLNGTSTSGGTSLVVSELINAFAGTNAVISSGKATASQLLAAPSTTTPLSNWLQNQPAATSTQPKAFINWVLFDEQFKFVKAGVSRVGSDGVLKDHYPELQNIDINKSGYLYVYCSNESPVNVFFDNLQVVHTRGALLEETHYYPFGLTMSGISSKAAGSLPNKLKYSSKEEQCNEFSDGSGLELYDYGARYYDRQTGRWPNVDELAESYSTLSPYNFVTNNPINGIDPDGRDVIFLNDKSAVVGGGLVGHAAVIIGNAKDGWYYYSLNGTAADGENGSMYGDSKNPDVGTPLGHGDNSNDLAKAANTINGNKTHNYDRFVRIKTTPEEDKLMKAKAAKAASVKKYCLIGASCLDVQKSAYEALAGNRIGKINALIAPDALKILEPNQWLNNLPYASSTINAYIWLTGGNNYLQAPPKRVGHVIVYNLNEAPKEN